MLRSTLPAEGEASCENDPLKPRVYLTVQEYLPRCGFIHRLAPRLLLGSLFASVAESPEPLSKARTTDSKMSGERDAGAAATMSHRCARQAEPNEHHCPGRWFGNGALDLRNVKSAIAEKRVDQGERPH